MLKRLLRLTSSTLNTKATRTSAMIYRIMTLRRLKNKSLKYFNDALKWTPKAPVADPNLTSVRCVKTAKSVYLYKFCVLPAFSSLSRCKMRRCQLLAYQCLETADFGLYPVLSRTPAVLTHTRRLARAFAFNHVSLI